MFKLNNRIIFSVLLSLFQFISIFSQQDNINLSEKKFTDNVDSDVHIEQNDSSEILSEKDMDNILRDLNEQFNSVEPEENHEVDLINFFQNPVSMAEKLPDDLRIGVLDAYHVSNKTVAFLLNPDLANNPVVLFNALLNDLHGLIDDDKFLEILIVIHGVISDESFNLKIQNNQPISDILKNQFKQNLDLLNGLFKSIKNDLDKVALNKLKRFRDILKFLSIGNLDKFFDLLASYKKNENLYAKKMLSLALNGLDKLIKISRDEVVLNAARFWKETVFAELMPIISSIDNNGNLDQTSLMLLQAGSIGKKANDVLNFANKTAKFAPSILSSYGFYKQVLNYYLLDNGVNWKSFILDGSITTMVLPVYLLKKIADIKDSEKGFNQASLVGLYHDVSNFYRDPNFLFQNSSFVARSATRIGSSIAYYNLLYRNHEKNDNNLKNKNSNYRYWPKNFKHLNNAIWKSVQDGYLSVGQLFENQIKQNIDPLLLNSIEDKSFGLVTPGLISFGINTMAPILTHRYFPKNIANLDRDIVFGKRDLFSFIDDKSGKDKSSQVLNVNDVDSDKLISRYLFNPINAYLLNPTNKYIINPARKYVVNPSGKYFFNPIGAGIRVGFEFAISSDSRYYVGERDISRISDAQFIENRVLGYLSVSIGHYFGKKAALKMRKKFKSLIINLLLKTINVFGLIDFKTAINELNDEETVGLSDNDKKFFILRSMLKENIPVFFMLKDVPGISEIKKIFFDSLIISKTFTEEELAKFELEFLSGQITESRLNEFVDGIIDNLIGIISQKIGGFIGGITSRTIVDHLVRNHHRDNTYYDRLKDKFSTVN